MPTRKELLEELRNEIGHLSNVVTDGSYDVRASAGALEEHGHAQIQAAETIAEGLKEAGGTILVASVVGGVLGVNRKCSRRPHSRDQHENRSHQFDSITPNTACVSLLRFHR